MARIKLGSIISDISGSVGGTTFQRNSYGVTMRSKPTQIGSTSASQAIRQTALRLIQNVWANLSSDVQNSWNFFPSFHSQKSKNNASSELSGYNLFLKYNLIHYQLFNTVLSVISYDALNLSSFVPQVRWSSPYLYFSLTGAVTDSKIFYGLYLSNVQPLGSQFKGNKIRFMTSYPFDATEIDITESFVAKFGAHPSVGENLSIKISIIGRYVPIVFSALKQSITVTS
jgi:hypothetical protein